MQGSCSVLGNYGPGAKLSYMGTSQPKASWRLPSVRDSFNWPVSLLLWLQKVIRMGIIPHFIGEKPKPRESM